MGEEKFISVIIPNRNGSATIARCLEALYASDYKSFEVIVVDDCSSDGSIGIIKKFPCKLIQLEKHSGVSKARNVGAKSARGVLFFIDNDCVLQRNTLSAINKKMQEGIKIVGGTYTKIPYYSKNFFDTFQSIYVNYVETKHKEPDYLAAHSMAIDAHLFKEVGGFVEDSFIGFAASVEDVEFSHRLRKKGHKLLMSPEIQVQHIFNFDLWKSLRNATKKSMYWTMYSIKNKDLTRDSGAASSELKVNAAAYLTAVILMLLYFYFHNTVFILLILIIAVINLFVNRRLIAAFHSTKGFKFMLAALFYYTMLYSLAVSVGAVVGALKYFWNIKLLRRYK